MTSPFDGTRRARGRKTGPLGLSRCRGAADAHTNARLVLGLAQLALTAVELRVPCCGLRAGNRPCLGHSCHPHAVYEADRRIQD